MPNLVGSIAFADDGRLLVALPDQIALYETTTGGFNRLQRRPRAFRTTASMMGDAIAKDGSGSGRCTISLQPRRGVSIALIGGRAEALPLWNPHSQQPRLESRWANDVLRRLVAPADICLRIDPDAGELGGKRVVATTEPPGVPDGSTVDAEGYLWNAEYNAGRVVRYRPDGRIDRIVALPTPHPTCCAFGVQISIFSM